MRAINVLLAILVSLVIGVAVLEGGLRLLGFGPPKNLLRFDPVAGWSKKANATQKKHTPEYSVTLRTNAQGLRDDAMESPSKPAGTFRVLALGDSFTQGWSVSRDDLFVDILERWWKAEGRPVDVVNGGTEGWSTDQEVAWFLDQGSKFQPDLVLLFPYENDLFWCSETNYPPDLDKPRFTPEGQLEARTLVDHAAKMWTDDYAITRLFFRPRAEKGRFDFTPPGGTRPLLKEFAALLEDPPAFMADAEARAAGALRALKQRCGEIGAHVVVVPIPSHSAVDESFAQAFGQKHLKLPRERWSPELPVQAFKRLAQQVGLDTVDVLPELRKAAAGEPLFFEVDWHFNPAGNAVFARLVKEQLDSLHVFPASQQAVPDVPEPVAAHTASAGLPFAAKLYLVLWAVLSTLFIAHYPKENKALVPLKIGVFLGAIFGIFLGARWLVAQVPPQYSKPVFVVLIGAVLVFVAYKLGRRLGTIAELVKSFTLRGHWYLMPLLVVLLTVGSLLVVAASSPLVAPFIYTLF